MTVRTAAFTWSIVLLAALAVVPAWGQQPRGPGARVDALFAEWDRLDSPGAAVAVVRNGSVLYRNGYGAANLEHRVPITPATVFDIASVSKQFAGMAVAMLVGQGAISLDDDVRTYLPEVPRFGGRTITVDHLVHHTSGLRDWPGTLAVGGWRMDDVIAFDQILTMAWHQDDLNFDPGAEYLYSNTGYNLLAELVRRVTGQSFRAWTDANIFHPLGMTRTHFHDDHTEVVRNRAYAYSHVDGAYRALPNGLTALGSSSLFSTVDDLARWIMNFDTPVVGGHAAVDRLRQRGVLNGGDTIAYAFGVSIGDYRGATTVSHSGSWAGFRTFLVHFPALRFGVVVLANLASFDPAAKAYAVADIYLGRDLEPRPDRAASGRETVPVAPAVLDAYVGTYRLGPGWLVTITREGGALMTQATAEDRFPTTPRSATEFYVEAYGASIHFRRGDGGAVDRVEYRGIVAPRVEPYAPTRVELAALAGAYRSDELDTDYVIALDEEGLSARHRRHGVIRLSPVLRDEFRGSEWFFRGVEFVRDGSGGVTGMRVSNGRSWNLWFVKVGS